MLDPTQTQLWTVFLVGHGADAQLSAHSIAAVRSDDQGIITRLDIRENLLARGIVRVGCVHVEIYDWSKSTDSICQRALTYVDSRIVRKFSAFNLGLSTMFTPHLAPHVPTPNQQTVSFYA